MTIHVFKLRVQLGPDVPDRAALARAIHAVAWMVETADDSQVSFPLLDSDGETIGGWEIVEEEDSVEERR